jgi:hypothetical protein
MASDQLSAALAEIRHHHRQHVSVNFPAPGPCMSRCAGPWPCQAWRAASAVEAALSHHKRDPLYGNAATEGEPGNCPHDPDSPLHFEAGDGSGEWLCEGRPEGTVCGSCTDGPCGDRLEWPCPEYLAILAALTGEGNTDG